MQKSALSRISGWLVSAVGIVFGCTLGTAQQPSSNLPPFKAGTIPFTSAVTNGNITFSWPVMPGRWELAEKNPAATGQWGSVPAEQYKTNGMTVSVTLPLPKDTAYFRVRRSLGFHIPRLPSNLPPVPPPPTNIPPNFKPHPR